MDNGEILRTEPRKVTEKAWTAMFKRYTEKHGDDV
jgi:hypothetical protein